MRTDVRELISDAGALEAVTGLTAESGRFTALAFRFPEGTLRLCCDAETDEIIAEVARRDLRCPSAAPTALHELVGMTVEYGWELTNHRGYVDALQLRFLDKRRNEHTRQFEVAASAMDVRRVTTL